MRDWIYNLPVVWMALVVCVAAYIVTAGIFWIVTTLAQGERARAFKAVSPGMLPPLGIIFGLFVAFLAAQVWGDFDRAQAAVNREASALRAVVLLSGAFPGEPKARLRSLIGRHIEEAVKQEWPAMSRHRATLSMIPAPLAEALQLSLAFTPQGDGQAMARQQIVDSLQSALEARRQRIVVSETNVNWVKWTSTLLQALCMLIAIAMVHSDNRLAAGIAMGLFATGVAASVVLIASHSGPFSGDISVGPDLLLQVMPEGN